jgi:hypothetical protein
MAYMLLEEKLRLKNIKLQKLEDDLKLNKDKFLKGMNENKDEMLNENGVSRTSSLTVRIVEARDLKPMNYDGLSDPYAQITLGDKKVLSNYKTGTLNPEWNEEFSMSAKSKNLLLKVEVFNKRKFGGDDFLGYTMVKLKDLEDQLKSDKWYKLENNNNSDDNGEVRLKCEFIWSRYKHNSDNYVKTEQQISRLHEDFDELKRIINLFEKPFGLLVYGEVDNIIKKRLLERSEDVGHYMNTSRRTVFNSPRYSVNKSHAFAERVENVFRATFSIFY